MKLLLTRVLAMALFMLPAIPAAGIAPPAPGVEVPQAFLDRLAEERDAFQFQNAWLGKVRKIRENRQRYIYERGFFHRDLVPPEQKPQLSVTGTIYTPVISVKFANTLADPYATSVLTERFFTGPHTPRTLTEYYSEISYGDFTIAGTVYGWYQLAQNDTYYEGPPGCNGLCVDDKVQEMVLEALAASDAGIDFGQYDNDGPDGVPNSGDDDGYADFVTVVQPESGGECGGDNIWSHRSNLTYSAGSPYATDDPAAGGGNILVNDYVILPAYNCNTGSPTDIIDIGLVAHEFGHALDLPDLYDVDGGSFGIGYWGLMGHGLYNTRENPAHMSSWCKTQMGWTNVIRASGEVTSYSLPPAELARTVYRLDIMNERWRRRSDCPISGSWAMRCGLSAVEGASRGWAAGDGYGDMWRERMYRDFSWDGTTPVTLSFDYSVHSEPGYDFTYVRIDVGGTVSTLATYDGNGSGSANIDLSPYLSGSGVSTYRISFEFESDLAASDRDGYYNSSCGPFVADNIGVVGGGENHMADFEAREEGWCVDNSDVDEYFLVTNRQPVGSDVNVPGFGGINIWHINQNVTRTGQLGNTGGVGNSRPRGVAVEQADNLFHLENNMNRGDGGDPFPGNGFNYTFDNNSQPGSRGYNGGGNNTRVVNISSNPANGSPMTADMSGGWGRPQYTSHTPTSAPAGSTVTVSITGWLIRCGAWAELHQGGTVIQSQNDVWSGRDLLDVDFDLSTAPPGSYDLVLFNPSGARVAVVDTFTVDDPATATFGPTHSLATTLAQNYPNPFNPSTTIPFELARPAHTTLRIYNIRGQVVRTLVDRALASDRYEIQWDGRNDAGARVTSGVYFYKLVAGSFNDVRKMVVTK